MTFSETSACYSLESAPGLLLPLSVWIEKETVHPVKSCCSSQEREDEGKDGFVGGEEVMIQAPPGIKEDEGYENKL